MGEVVVWEQLAHDLAKEFGSDFVRDFAKSITDEVEAERELAFAKQRKVAAATARLDQCYMDGLGQCHMRVDPEVFWHWVHRYGREVWNDKSFLKAFKRDNPEVRVLARPRKVTVRRP
jgi:hypothetical protein